jgi:FMN phosphatase YigB (HAD superfamily)
MELQEAAFAYDVSHPEVVATCIRANDHALTVVSQIAQRNRQVVISNTKPEAISRFIWSVGLEDYFLPDHALAVDMHSQDGGRTKAEVLAEYLERHPVRDIVIIGDSPTDMALSAVAGGKRYHYVHPGRKFRKCVSDAQIHDLRAVLRSL